MVRTIRAATPHDADTLRRLAALHNRPQPHGHALLAERDGVPLAAEQKAQFSVGFLFLKATGGATEKWTFVRRDDRLVVTRHERASSGGGMGQSTEGSETQSIALR